MDDRTMLVLVQVLLDHPQECALKPEVLRELLLRLQALLERETAKRPTHRPRQDTGASVARFYELCGDFAKAKRLVARMEGKTLDAVAKAYQRHQKRQK
jgi:hypothetical protein